MRKNDKKEKKDKKRRGKNVPLTPEEQHVEDIKDFLDVTLPGNVRIYDSYVAQDNVFRSVWAVRAYPTTTEDQAILRHLGERSGVTLHIYCKELTAQEEERIVRNADNRNRMMINSVHDTQQNIQAQENAQDIVRLIQQLHRDKENLVHCSVFIEMMAPSVDELHHLEMEVRTELKICKIDVDVLHFRQEQGYLSTMPGGYDAFNGEFSRAIPQSSVANLFPMSYSGKTDPHGTVIGKDTNGSYIIADLNKKDNTHTNSNTLILGNAGQGKSYLTKGLIINLLEEGKNVLILDPEHEYEDLVRNMNGDYLDLMDGQYMINVLEPKVFTTVDDGTSVNDDSETTKTFRTKGQLSQHVSFLRDFFSIYKDLTRKELDILENILFKLYESFGITNDTDLTTVPRDAYPTMSDLWAYTESIAEKYDEDKALYAREDLRDVRLALQSLCAGAESRYFDGHTNINTHSQIIGFGLKGVMEADESLKNAMLFNCLSYMSDKLLTQRNTAAVLDEFYLFLSSQVSVEYCRNVMKRDRKFDSLMILASQNIEDFLDPRIASYTKPLFSIPVHKFLFNPGTVKVSDFTGILQLEPSEYKIIQYPQRGHCLYVCGNERYSLNVSFPKFKSDMFGTAGGN